MGLSRSSACSQDSVSSKLLLRSYHGLTSGLKFSWFNHVSFQYKLAQIDLWFFDLKGFSSLSGCRVVALSSSHFFKKNLHRKMIMLGHGPPLRPDDVRLITRPLLLPSPTARRSLAPRLPQLSTKSTFPPLTLKPDKPPPSTIQTVHFTSLEWFWRRFCYSKRWYATVAVVLLQCPCFCLFLFLFISAESLKNHSKS
jgi:hypothetical protein